MWELLSGFLWKILGIFLVSIGLMLVLIPVIPGFPIILAGLLILLGKEKITKINNKILSFFQKFKKNPP